MTDFFFDPEIFDEADRIYAEVGEVRRKATVEKISPVGVDISTLVVNRTPNDHRQVNFAFDRTAPDDGWEIW